MKHAALSLCAFAILSGCATTAGDGTERVRLIDPALQGSPIGQCSRAGPDAPGGYFRPVAAEITALETALAKELDIYRASRGPDVPLAPDDRPFEFLSDPESYVREYLGYAEGGRRKIYGNFMPLETAPERSDNLTVICDGGSQFFGVEYDIEARRITRIAFNGFLRPVAVSRPAP